MKARGIIPFGRVAGLCLLSGLAVVARPAEALTLIGSCPYTIELPGIYVVSRDLSCPGDVAAIEINADNVRLLLGRRTLTGGGEGEGFGVRAAGTSEDPVEGLRISGGSVTGFSTGVRIEHAPGAVVSRVTSVDNSSRGIYVDASPGARLLHNTVRGNDRGLYVEDCDGCLISRNHAIGNAVSGSSDGIWLDGTTGARVEGNVATGNGDDGLELVFNSTGNFIRLNAFTRNNGSGIDVADGSRSNRILLNLATGNNVGGIGSDQDLADRNISSGCLNSWRANRFAIDNEGDGPGQGCIR